MTDAMLADETKPHPNKSSKKRKIEVRYPDDTSYDDWSKYTAWGEK